MFFLSTTCVAAFVGLTGFAGAPCTAEASDLSDGRAPAHSQSYSAEADGEQVAAEHYMASLRDLFGSQIVPAVRHGILSISASRPPNLTIAMTDDPSPYRIVAAADANGSLTVKLSLGYAVLHDAALDAVVVAEVLGRPNDLQRYLIFQLRMAQINDGLRAKRRPIKKVPTFAQFARIAPETARAIYAEKQSQRKRSQAQVRSLGWVVSYLLTEADPKLAGSLPLPPSRHAEAAGRLAAASGWFPIPPFATALHMAAIDSPRHVPQTLATLLCRAAILMEGGIAGLHTERKWQQRWEQNADLQRGVTEIETQIAAMRRDGGCPKSAMPST